MKTFIIKKYQDREWVPEDYRGSAVNMKKWPEARDFNGVDDDDKVGFYPAVAKLKADCNATATQGSARRPKESVISARLIKIRPAITPTAQSKASCKFL